MPQYTAPGIIFAKATPANLAVATSASGGVEADVTDRINPVSLASGFISTTPTNITGTFSALSSGNTVVAGTGTSFTTQCEVGDRLYYYDAPDYVFIGVVASITSNTSLTLTAAAEGIPTGGDTLAINTNVITGVGTEFTTQFAAGDYLFYYDASGNPNLIGRIASTPSVNTQITLVDNWTVDITNKYCGGINVIASGSESFLIRIPVVPQGSFVNGYPTQVFLPNWNSFRLTPDRTSYNDDTVSSIATYSLVGNPSVPGGVTQVPYSISPLNIFNSIAAPTQANPNNRILWPPLSSAGNAAFPNFVFALFNPYGDNQGDNMAQNTMFKFLCTQTITGFLTGANTAASTLLANGYSASQIGATLINDTNTQTNTN